MRYYTNKGQFYSHSNRVFGKEITESEYKAATVTVITKEPVDSKLEYAATTDKVGYIAKMLGLE